ncbi:MAG: diaminopimelate epimerase [Gemmatimonadota bacterium]
MTRSTVWGRARFTAERGWGCWVVNTTNEDNDVSASETQGADLWWAGDAFRKAHGHGNDYLVFARGESWPVSASAVRTVCDRWRGVGGDGVVIVDASQTPIRLRMFNPDGGEFEKSGNGLRVTAAWLLAAGEVGAEPFVVEVGGSAVRMQIHGRDEEGRLDVEAEMGHAAFGPEAVGLVGSDALADAAGRPLEGIAVSMGNPHFVVFGVDPDADLARLGPWICSHRRFTRGTNVQLAQVENGGLRIGIWERGVGRTSSSGTSACAATAAAVKSGRLPAGSHVVQMEGGTFQVTVRDDWSVVLRGPVEEVMSGTLATALVRRCAD